ncbi:MAG: T9SS type A sorting domain-containing protein, partial [Bacteroidia bacterium]|nr:T9SS type A sorting domain-containing protein [Bacteroidia bacterium]
TSINRISNNGIFNNNKQAFFIRLANNGTFNNNDYLEIETLNNNGSFTNRDSTTTNNVYNQGIINNEAGGNIEVEKIVLNKSTLNTKANIKNNGSIQIFDNLTNFDTLSGTIGRYDIQDTTINYGVMTGSFTLCDHTPPTLFPYIDSNSGVIDNNINWCVLTSIVKPETQNNISVYPNPASYQLFINNRDQKNITIRIYDALGNIIESYQNESTINISTYPNGAYMIMASDSQKIVLQTKIIINK